MTDLSLDMILARFWLFMAIFLLSCLLFGLIQSLFLWSFDNWR